jgi:hypothetical protein
MDIVNYGAVKYFDKVKRGWRISMGPMSALEDGMSIMNPQGGSSFDFTKWSAPIEILGIEDEKLLPRPLINVAHLKPIKLDFRLEKQMLELLPPGIYPDLSKGAIFYEGRIGEPTKFKVAKKDELRGVAYEDIISNLTDIFPITRSTFFHLWGQAFYTYNPEDIGVALYRNLGYPLSPGLPPIPVGNEMWPMQENYPGNLHNNNKSLFALYRNNFDSSKRRLARCLNLMKL